MVLARHVVVVILLVGLGALVGCGGSEPRTYPVSGIVLSTNNRVVISGVVEFAPVGGGPSARGQIGQDGQFTLMTGDRPGAVAGVHQVVIVQVGNADVPGHKHKHKPVTVHRKYARFETSGLTQKVEPESNYFFIEVGPAQ